MKRVEMIYMKKVEMIKNLEAVGVEVPDIKWLDFKKFYKEKMEELKPPTLSKPTEASVNERVEKKIEKQPDLRTPLEIKRAELFPQIVDLMNKLKGKSNATHQELQEMFSLYNQFYLRNDNPSCGSCIGRIYKSFQKMCKGRF